MLILIHYNSEVVEMSVLIKSNIVERKHFFEIIVKVQSNDFIYKFKNVINPPLHCTYGFKCIYNRTTFNVCMQSFKRYKRFIVFEKILASATILAVDFSVLILNILLLR